MKTKPDKFTEKIYGSLSKNNISLTNNVSLNYKNNNLEIAFYGEIYNADLIRKKLSCAGINSNSNSVHEVLGKSYIEWGTAFIRELNGAFSCCIYDRTKNSALLFRDQVGKKFLYYSFLNNNLIFSSNVNEILKTQGFPREVDLEALNIFLANRSIPTDLCIFKYIHKLAPGSYILYDINSMNLQTNYYWKHSEPQCAEVEKESEIILELEDLILESLRIRTNSDGSTGAFLSGGIDSSLLVAMMARLSDNPLKTFCIGFKLDKYNEVPYSSIVAKHYHTHHKELFIDNDFDIFIEAASMFDEPLGDPSIYPTYFAYKLAAEYVDNIISGDGADSLFLGNRSNYLAYNYHERKKYMVFPINYISDKIGTLLPEETKWKIFLENISAQEFYHRRGTVFTTNLRRKLFPDWIVQELGQQIFEPEYKKTSKNHKLTDYMTQSAFRAHQNSTIFKVERLSNNFSLNVRTPFLDTKLVDYGFSKVPGELKIKGGVTKYILKKIAKKYLPQQFPMNRKQGLNPPFSEWIRKEWNIKVRDILLSGEETYLSKKYVENLLETHKNPIFDQGRKIFNLLVFKIWELKYLHDETL